MSEVKEVCPSCGNVDFGILRDMTSRRVCKCGNTWDAPTRLWGWDCKCGGLPIPVTPVTEYQKLKSDYDYLKTKLEKAEAVLKYYADRTNYTLDDYYGVSGEMSRRVILYGDQEEFNEFSSAAGRRAREYMKGEG